MKERPISFSPPMVRAILEGRKTQTRRILKESLVESINYMGGFDDEPATSNSAIIRFQQWRDDSGKIHGPEWCVSSAEYPEEGVVSLGQCPHGQPGDKLWVRENGWEKPNQFAYLYDADDLTNGNDAKFLKTFGWKRRPSIFMPKWASRITLELTNVRVERLDEVSEGDAIAEGWNPHADENPGNGGPFDWYKSVWESINGRGSWDKNPWVWVEEFRLI